MSTNFHKQRTFDSVHFVASQNMVQAHNIRHVTSAMQSVFYSASMPKYRRRWRFCGIKVIVFVSIDSDCSSHRCCTTVLLLRTVCGICVRAVWFGTVGVGRETHSPAGYSTLLLTTTMLEGMQVRENSLELVLWIEQCLSHGYTNRTTKDGQGSKAIDIFL